MMELDLTASRFGPPGDLSTNVPLLMAHVENFRARHGRGPDRIAITPEQYGAIMPFLAPPARRLLGLPIAVAGR
jgi:hypothetical protein